MEKRPRGVVGVIVWYTSSCTVSWSIQRNHEIPGRASDGPLQAAAVSVRVIYQPASAVPCCVHLVFPLMLPSTQVVPHRCYQKIFSTTFIISQNLLLNSLIHILETICLDRYCSINHETVTTSKGGEKAHTARTTKTTATRKTGPDLYIGEASNHENRTKSIAPAAVYTIEHEKIRCIDRRLRYSAQKHHVYMTMMYSYQVPNIYFVLLQIVS